MKEEGGGGNGCRTIICEVITDSFHWWTCQGDSWTMLVVEEGLKVGLQSRECPHVARRASRLDNRMIYKQLQEGQEKGDLP